jgi:hypothetical protein
LYEDESKSSLGKPGYWHVMMLIEKLNMKVINVSIFTGRVFCWTTFVIFLFFCFAPPIFLLPLQQVFKQRK